MHQTLTILDFGSQYTQLIARRVREMGVFCEIRPCTDPAPSRVGDRIGVILSGGPASVLGPDAPAFDQGWLELGLPVLGICYGMQLLANALGGRVAAGIAREYGAADVRLDASVSSIFADFSPAELHPVWMSHGDHVVAVPPGWREAGRSANGVMAAMARADGRAFALQFHPEVAHTRNGAALLRRFVREVCGATGDWTPGSFVEDTVDRIREQVGEDRVICALSGGVDSSVVAALLHRAIGDRLHCVFVDNGLLRSGEAEGVRREFGEFNLVVVDAAERFVGGLAGVTDPERKRKIIGEMFIRVFEEQAAALPRAKWLAQGTLYPDVIESVSVRGPSATIKTHHNVGGLPERMALSLVEPLRELFKDEVRSVGETLGLSAARVWRQPFPGPGLAVRCLGEVTPPRLATLRAADAIVREEIAAAGLERAIWQSFCVLLPVRTVGVMGDERTYDEVCAIRAVHSGDGMTADWVPLPHDLLGRMSSRIINQVRGVNRVVYDISSKPPATIEWE